MAGDGASALGPVVLFDGVCNLCNAWVRWLIERDRVGVFGLASLQSTAARDLLRSRLTEQEIEALPDAIVLVDASGVHTRSSAVLRITARLGFPWKALSWLRIVPSPVRDAVYRVVARNRYRWFGHRDVCMVPTPETAARFLDASEPRGPAVVADPASVDAPARSPVRAWAVRFAVAYSVLYMLPFPLTLLSNVARVPLIGDVPGLQASLGWVLGLWPAASTALVGWVGDAVFGIEVSAQPTGSGDRSFDYVKLVVDLTLAVTVALAWTAIARARVLSSTWLDVFRVLARYYLGWFLLIYGWAKVFPLQMPPPGPDRLLQAYGDSSPMGIAWTFIGASTSYQIFSGLAEITAGYLLFWRRTALLGSLLAMAVMLNVMAINFFYDVPVKLFSTHLFLYGAFIAAPDLPRLIGLFGLNLPVAADATTPFWRKLGWRYALVASLNLLLVGTLTTFHLMDGYQASTTRGVLADTHRFEGIYVVDSFEQDGLVDRENDDAARWVRLGVNMPSITTIQRATGESVRMLMAIDTMASTLSFYDRGGQPPPEPQFTYVERGGGGLELTGTFEGKATTVEMRRLDTDPLLTGRGFRWINEFPFNR